MAEPFARAPSPIPVGISAPPARDCRNPRAKPQPVPGEGDWGLLGCGGADPAAASPGQDGGAAEKARNKINP